ncbi:MAG TPA: VOC family protein [Solirubrobacteraceae bacterium]|jgi:catechol 2,3-dioxygenase-like lactoylglutathione lyase family enzyme
MRLRPIHFVSDVDEAVRFYEALGLTPELRSRSGHWVELQASGGELGLHDSAIAADGEGREGLALNFLAEEPLEQVEQRLLAAGFPPQGTIVDHEWGRALQVKAPDGTVVQIDERDTELYT